MASLVRVTEAAGTVITIAELKSQIRYFESDEDAVLAAYVRSAQDWVAQALGRPLLEETWEYRLDYFPCYWVFQIPLPIRSITSIKYIDFDGVQRTVDPAVYLTVGDTLYLAYGKNWPMTRREAGAVRVSFVSGFGPDHNYVPELVRECVMLLAARFFEQRESLLGQGLFESSLLDQLLLPYKWRLAEAV
jgi:uncharacterized phiE125 gp8 family phage protein